MSEPRNICPECGAPGATTTRIPRGDTVCMNGHVHPSAEFDAEPEEEQPE